MHRPTRTGSKLLMQSGSVVAASIYRAFSCNFNGRARIRTATKSESRWAWMHFTAGWTEFRLASARTPRRRKPSPNGARLDAQLRSDQCFMHLLCGDVKRPRCTNTKPPINHTNASRTFRNHSYTCGQQIDRMQTPYSSVDRTTPFLLYLPL